MKRLKKQGLDDYILYIISLSLVSLTILSSLVLTHTTPSAHADASSSATATVSVSEVCSLTSTVDTPHTAEMHNGLYSGTDYASGIGQTTLKAFCNDGLGFAIYAIGYTNDEYGNTKLHWSGASSSSDATHDISTGIYESGTTTNSTWSMKLASVAGTYAPTVMDGTNDTENFTTWHVVPDSYAKVAYKTTGTDVLVNNTGTGSSVTVTYDAYISATQPAGTYIGQVKYTLVHPSTAAAPVPPMRATDCPANSICYAPNAGDIEGTMISEVANTTALSSISNKYPTAAKQINAVNANGSTVGVTSNSTVTLVAPNYKREGYGFAGWSTDFTATNSSTIYGPNETINTGDLSTNGLILYPVWVASAGNLQGWSGCSGLTAATYNSTSGTISATLSSLTALTDTRDGNVYTVARLADEQCWMVENLRLDSTTTISTTDTNNPLHDANNNVILKTDYTNGTTANHLAATSNSWCIQYNQASCTDQTMLNTNNTNFSDTGFSASHNSSSAAVKWSSYGNYYNWYSATAGNGTYSKSSGNTDGDLCPTGWHLPYGNSGNSGTNIGNTAGGFYYLGNIIGATANSAASSVKWRAFPNNFIYSGYWGGAQASNRSSYGHYWSSSANSVYSAYDLYFNSSSVYPGTYNYSKYHGYSVRCVAGS